MVYLYAVLGVMMISGIMAIFEMALSLTGQSMIPAPSDKYLSSASMKAWTSSLRMVWQKQASLIQ